MRSTSTVLLALSLAACSQEQLMEEITTKTIGANGGEALSADGKVRLLFPSGALSQDTTITIRTSPDALQYASKVYELSPDGQPFARPVIIEFLRIQNVDGDEVSLAQIKNGQQLLLASSQYDADSGKVSAQLEHFSSYAAIRHRNPCAQLACGDPCTWCNPSNTSCVEPPFAKACNVHGHCVPASPNGLGCTTNPADAGPIDSGPPADSGIVDGGIPDSGITGAPEEVEPNNDMATANQVGGSDFVFQPTTHGSNTPTGDVDYYSFYVLQGNVALVRALTYTQFGNTNVCMNADTILTLYDSNGVVLATNDDYGVGFCSKIETNVPAGTYYLAVSPYGGQMVASYFLDITLLPGTLPVDAGVPDVGSTPGDASVPMDAGVATDSGIPPALVTEVEPNEPQAAGQVLGAVPGMTTIIEAAIMPAGDQDFFLFTVPANTTVNAHAITYTTLGDRSACSNADTYIEIRDANGAVLAANDDRMSAIGCSELTVALPSGDYALFVRHFAAQVGTIALYYVDLDL